MVFQVVGFHPLLPSLFTPYFLAQIPGSTSDATTRSNAFEVYTDGSIRMARQGDVLMGPYGY